MTSSSVSAQTYWGHWMLSTAVTKERPNSVPRNTLAGDEWYRKKKTAWLLEPERVYRTVMSSKWIHWT